MSIDLIFLIRTAKLLRTNHPDLTQGGTRDKQFGNNHRIVIKALLEEKPYLEEFLQSRDADDVLDDNFYVNSWEKIITELEFLQKVVEYAF